MINAIAGIARPRRGRIRINDTCLFDAAKGIDLPPEQAPRSATFSRMRYSFRTSM